MDIYVLNSQFRRIEIIDEYESFLWSERFKAISDFKIMIETSAKVRASIQFGNYIIHDESDVPMRIEEIFEEDKDGQTFLAITGRTLEGGFFESRAVSPQWIGNGPASAVIANLVQIICVDGTGISPNDAFNGFEFFVYDTVTGSDHYEGTAKNGQSLYSAVREAADWADIGFKITYEYGMYVTNLIFTVYGGTNRPSLLFSTELDTLMDPSYLQSIKNYRNIAYVFHEQGIKIVPRAGTDINVAGVARKVIHVDAMDVKPADHVLAEYNAILTQRGLNALYSPEGQMVKLFDGEVPLDSPYRYGRDYFLGDIVTFKGPVGGGLSQRVRITEYIWSCDSQGTKAYPTFSVID